MSILTIIRQRRHRRSQIRTSTQQRSQRAAFGFGFAVSAVLVIAVLVTALAYASLTRGLPPVEELPILLNPGDGQLLQPTRLYDRTGQYLLAVLAPSNSTRIYAPFGQLPKTLIDATLAAAEPNFWYSPGYVLGGWQEPDKHQTLAQRLVSALLLADQPATPLRGIHERMLAAQITAGYGRQQILEWYLNSANYGHYAYGAEAAAQEYFGKSITQIDLGEAAMLAAISQAPAINPIDTPQAAEQNRLKVLQAMLDQGMINPADAAEAVRNPPSPPAPTATGEGGVTPSPAPTPTGEGGVTPSQAPIPTGEEGVIPLLAPSLIGEGQIAPAFIRMALAQMDAYFGAGRVERGGLNIITSLDYDLQLQAACVAQAQLNRLSGSASEVLAMDGTPCTAARLLPSLQPGESLAGASASLLVLDPHSGQILAVVGDMETGAQGNSLGLHPAGTAITPFVYLTGFSRGFNPASLGWDIAGSTTTPGQVYHGPVRLRTALANDYLIPARQLLDQMGQESVQSISAPFGLNFPSGIQLLKDDFPISPLALAEAYGIFANSGTLAGENIANGSLHSNAVLEVQGWDHSTWADWRGTETRLLLSQQLAYLMNQVLSDETARWPSLGHPNPLEIGRPAGAKLARSLDLSAAWAIGYTPERVAVVWLGSGSGKIQNASEGNVKSAADVSDPAIGRLSADLWHALMQYAVRDLPSVSWDMPTGIVSVPVCDPSGLLPTAVCPNVVNEIFLEGRQPVQLDSLYQTFEVNSETKLLATVFTPPELVEKRTYMVVPAEARGWARSVGLATPPTAYDTIQRPPVLADVHITAPGMFSDGRARLEIVGSARGVDFVSYRLEYGQGLYPTAWVEIGKDSKTAVTEGLLGEWDTTGLDGLYALRLMVVHSDQHVDQAVVQVTLDNTPPQVAITYPQAGQTISLAQEPQLALQAQASDPFLEKVEFYVDNKLVGQSSGAPFGVIWTARSGVHTLKVVATDRAGNTAQAKINFSVGK